MLTKEQIKATKDDASGAVKYWFTGHESQTKIAFKPNPDAEERGFTPDEDHRYVDEHGKEARDENGKVYCMVGERVPMALAEYFAEKVGTITRGKERLIKQFHYTDETFDQKLELYNESFWRCHALRQKNTDKHNKVLSKFQPIFDEAEKVAAAVDTSDIVDGFPCGSVHLYLRPNMHETELGKAIAFFNRDSTTDAYKYQLRIKYENRHQCISFDERICSVVGEFLQKKGVDCEKHTWID